MIYKLKEQKGFRQSRKLCRNLCSLRWLRPNLMRYRNVRPFGSKILYILVLNGWIKDNNLLLNTEIDSEFLMLRSKSNLTIRVEGKKENLKQSVQQLKMGTLLFLVLVFVSHFGTKFIKQLGASPFIILNITPRIYTIIST